MSERRPPHRGAADASVVVDNAEAFSAKSSRRSTRSCSGQTLEPEHGQCREAAREFKQAPFKNIQIADLRGVSATQAGRDVGAEQHRNFIQRLQKVIDAYNLALRPPRTTTTS